MNKLMILALVASSVTIINAEELQSFQGIRFGMKVSEGNFSGPDEDGDYSYIPEGKKPNPAIQCYISATYKSKRVYMVLMNHTVPLAAGSVLKREYMKALQGYSKFWTPTVKGDEFWTQQYEIVKGAVSDGLSPDDFYVFTFRDQKNKIRQVMVVMLIKTEYTATMKVTVTDLALSELDDAEKGADAKSKEDDNTVKLDLPVGFAAQAERQEAKKTKAKSVATNEDGKSSVVKSDRLISFCGIKFGDELPKTPVFGDQRTKDGKSLMRTVKLQKPFRGMDHATVFASIKTRKICCVQLEWTTEGLGDDAVPEGKSVVEAVLKRFPDAEKIPRDMPDGFMNLHGDEYKVGGGTVSIGWVQSHFMSPPSRLQLTAKNDEFMHLAKEEYEQESGGDGSSVL